jgi:predicted enzyme related to lactoylglutathione lyase
MIESSRYVHTNLIAHDWRALAGFYESVFSCMPVPPERDYSEEDIAAGTGVQGASLQGVHLRLPGCGENGPTLEIFTYSQHADGPDLEVNRPGLAHIAFAVAPVDDARRAVLASGGKRVGDIVTLTTSEGARVTWCYVRDPEGSVIELQSWE